MALWLLGLLLFLVPTWALAQPFSCNIREITRVANEHHLICDGIVTVLDDATYQAQQGARGNVMALCPPGTSAASMAGNVVRFDTASGEEELCDAYTSPNDPEVTIILAPGAEIALDTARDTVRDEGKLHQKGRIPGLTLTRGHLFIHNIRDVPTTRGGR
jgi:hypothetical protein